MLREVVVAIAPASAFIIIRFLFFGVFVIRRSILAFCDRIIYYEKLEITGY
jgi:hypothetical protein